jgi:hypothetical protein
MGSRLALQTLFEGILGSESVYFQPPESIKLTYPCIIYQRSFIRTDYANNDPYSLKKEYTVTVIERDPDSTLPDQIAVLHTARHDRYYTADMLHHNVFTLFY